MSVASSPLRRALETAAWIAAPQGLTAEPLAAFRELGFGRWEGLTGAEAAACDPEAYRRWTTDPAAGSPPGGETLREASLRAVPALEALVAANAGKKVALVTHSVILRILVCHALGADLSAVGRLRCDPGSITTVEVREGRYQVRLLNDACHLRGALGGDSGPSSSRTS